jgi:hypothetical protein
MDQPAVVKSTASPPPACTCAQPLPEIRAVRKGAARTFCARCGRPIRLSFDQG